MEELKNSILNCLQEYHNDEDLLVNQLNSIVNKEGAAACAMIFKILTHIDFLDEQAKTYWHVVLSHHSHLKKVLDRNVSIRTAICDFFCTVDVSLKNPKIIEIPVYEEKAKYSQYDFLTGLHTRSFFDEALEKEIGRARRHGMDLSILFFDLDKFKLVNDKFGHQAGDYILEEVSKIILNKQRKEDISARYGGEELVMILPHTKKLKAYIFAERIREAIEKSNFVYNDKKINITISGGIGSYPEDGQEIETIVKAADDALYLAKHSGRNEIIAYSNEKRLYLRVDFVKNLNIIGIDDNKESELNASSKNLSKSGILFEHNKPIELGTKLRLNLSIEENQGPIAVTGIVVRTESRGEDKFDIGVLFFNIENETKNEISRYIIRQLNKN